MFKHPIIQECAQELFQSHDLTAFLTLYKQVTQYAHIDDLLLYKEFLILTFFALHFTHKVRVKSSFSLQNDYALLIQFSITQLLDLTCELIHNPAAALHTLQMQTKYHEIPLIPETIDHLIFDEFGLSPEQFTLYIFRRFYIIKRLRHRFSGTTYMQLSNTQHATIRPLAYVWKDMCRYMFLSDQLIVDTHAQQLFLLSNTTLTTDNQKASSSRSNTINLPLIQDHNLLSDVMPFTPIKPILTRFCIIQKITPIINRLHADSTPKHIPCSINSNHFSHPVILKCIKEIAWSKSITPLFAVSEQFNRYYYLLDSIFATEYYAIIYIIYAQIRELIDHTTTLEQPSIEQLLLMEDEAILDAVEKIAYVVN